MIQPIYNMIRIWRIYEHPFFGGSNLEGSWEVYSIWFYYVTPDRNAEIQEWCENNLHGWWTFHKVKWNSHDDMWTTPRIDLNSDDDLMLLKLRFV